MDIPTAALYGGIGLALFAIFWRVTGNLQDLARERLETERMRSAWYTQMSRLKHEKGSKKARKKQEEDDDEEDEEADDLDVLIEAVRPYKAFIAGAAQSRRLPIDVERLFDHDAGEKAKVGAWIDMQMKKGPAANGAVQGGERDYWTQLEAQQ